MIVRRHRALVADLSPPTCKCGSAEGEPHDERCDRARVAPMPNYGGIDR